MNKTHYSRIAIDEHCAKPPRFHNRASPTPMSNTCELDEPQEERLRTPQEAENGAGNARAARLDEILRLPCVVGRVAAGWKVECLRAARQDEASGILLGAGAMAAGCGVVGTRWRWNYSEGGKGEDRGRFLLRLWWEEAESSSSRGFANLLPRERERERAGTDKRGRAIVRSTWAALVWALLGYPGPLRSYEFLMQMLGRLGLILLVFS
jgi:hypothetical protein